jgi:hypothetical protein
MPSLVIYPFEILQAVNPVAVSLADNNLFAFIDVAVMCRHFTNRIIPVHAGITETDPITPR